MFWEQMEAWNALKVVIQNVLGGKRAFGREMKNYVNNMMDGFKKIGSSMTYKMHLLSHHIDDFIKQSPKESYEHGEHFHQVTMPMESRFEGKRLHSMLAKVCW